MSGRWTTTNDGAPSRWREVGSDDEGALWGDLQTYLGLSPHSLAWSSPKEQEATPISEWGRASDHHVSACYNCCASTWVSTPRPSNEQVIQRIKVHKDFWITIDSLTPTLGNTDRSWRIKKYFSHILTFRSTLIKDEPISNLLIKVYFSVTEKWAP